MATVALGLALGALAAPASAVTQNAPVGATQSPTSTSAAYVTLHEVAAARGGDPLVAHSGIGALNNHFVSPDSSACVAPNFPGGLGICNTQALTLVDSNGNILESFVIGLDWSIWHAWPGSNGWHSLGGQAKHFVNTDSSGRVSGVFAFSDVPEIITVYGNDAAGTPYCDEWGTPTWGGWKPCSQF